MSGSAALVRGERGSTGTGNHMYIKSLKRLLGYVHILLGLAVAGQFVASPTYDVTTSTDVWDAMSFAMAVGTATALVVSLMRIREAGKLPDWRATTMLIAAASLFLLFFRLWLSWEVYDSAETPPWEIRLLLWYLIDVLFVIVSITVGRYLLRTAKSQASG